MANDRQQENKKSEYGELFQFLVNKFDKIDDKFVEISDKLDTKADKSDLDQKADKSDLDQKADKSDIERVLTRIGMLGNKIDDYRAEQLETRPKVERHEKWHFQIAEKVGVKLKD